MQTNLYFFKLQFCKEFCQFAATLKFEELIKLYAFFFFKHFNQYLQHLL